MNSPPDRTFSEFWFTEDVAPGHRIQTLLTNMLLRTHSQFQNIDVVETYFGKTLITDGKTQSAKFDEFAYHESLVHPAMVQCTYNNNNRPPKTVLIGGGGELATAREVLKWKSVERVVMVDLDGELVEICQQHLPEWGGPQVLQDHRFELVIGDAYQYCMDTEQVFDVIIMDISDPIEAGPGIMLYVQEFYQHLVTKLSPHGGVFVTQAGVADSIPPKIHWDATSQKDSSCIGPICNTLQSVFDVVAVYTANIPSFGQDWGYCMAYHGKDDKSRAEKLQETLLMGNQVVDEILQQFVSQELDYYDGMTHARLFHLTKPLRQSLRQDTRIMTKENPIFMY